ncbi:50S ribosomal protein L4, partial [Striga asiatica]
VFRLLSFLPCSCPFRILDLLGLIIVITHIFISRNTLLILAGPRCNVHLAQLDTERHNLPSRPQLHFLLGQFLSSAGLGCFILRGLIANIVFCRGGGRRPPAWSRRNGRSRAAKRGRGADWGGASRRFLARDRGHFCSHVSHGHRSYGGTCCIHTLGARQTRINIIHLHQILTLRTQIHSRAQTELRRARLQSGLNKVDPFNQSLALQARQLRRHTNHAPARSPIPLILRIRPL